MQTFTAPPLRDQQLLTRYAVTRDPGLREELVARYLPLAQHAARRYARGPETIDDLVQVASLGLLKAIDRYDPNNGAAFSSFAMPTITGELRRYFRDRTWAVRPPRDLQERSLAVDRMTERLSRTLGRSPTVTELAGHLGIGEEAVLEAREATQARGATSLSAPARGTGDDALSLADTLGHQDDGLAGAEHRATLSTLGRGLTAREREILRLRFEEDLTQAEVGERIGLSQMHVSRILRDTINKLRLAATAPAAA